ncbi:MAG: heme-binding protein [Chloroflexi bacterium]|nr:heme-binding protein [Chloroflexota bacterium]
MIGLEIARAALAGAEAEARRLGVAIAVAVVDAAGLPIALIRMDTAIPATAELALGKAFGAAYWQRPTSDLATLARDRPSFFAALMASARRPLVPSAGGLPIIQSGQLAGAIGVSGARSPEEDVICAQAGLIAAGLSPI